LPLGAGRQQGQWMYADQRSHQLQEQMRALQGQVVHLIGALGRQGSTSASVLMYATEGMRHEGMSDALHACVAKMGSNTEANTRE